MASVVIGGGGGGGGAQNNFSATAPPSATDDSGAGYSQGSVWRDTVGAITYVCLDDTVGDAVWQSYSGDVWLLDEDGELMTAVYGTAVVENRSGKILTDFLTPFLFETDGQRTKVVGKDGANVESYAHVADFGLPDTQPSITDTASDPSGDESAIQSVSWTQGDVARSVLTSITSGAIGSRIQAAGNNLFLEALGASGNIDMITPSGAGIRLRSFPNTRNDGSTTNALYTDASGHLRHGPVAGGGGGTVSDLSNTPSATDVLIGNTGGNDTTLPAATTSLAGVLTGADKTKLDGISAGATSSDLSQTTAATTVTVTNTGGTDAVLPAATTSTAGVMTDADKTKLDAAVTDHNLGVTNVAANYTLLTSDVDNIVVVNSASPVTITVPTGFSVGNQVLVRRRGTGTVTFVAGAGMTIEIAGTQIANQYESAAVIFETGTLAAVLGSIV